MPNAKKDASNAPHARKNQKRKPNGGEALNAAGYGFGFFRIVLGLLTSAILIALGVYFSSGKVTTGDPVRVTATLKKPGVYEVPVPDSERVREFRTGDERTDETIVVYYDRVEQGITLEKPTIAKSAGYLLIGLGVVGIAFTIIFWYLLRKSQTFRRIYGGVAAFDALR